MGPNTFTGPQAPLATRSPPFPHASPCPLASGLLPPPSRPGSTACAPVRPKAPRAGGARGATGPVNVARVPRVGTRGRARRAGQGRGPRGPGTQGLRPRVARGPSPPTGRESEAARIRSSHLAQSGGSREETETAPRPGPREAEA